MSLHYAHTAVFTGTPAALIRTSCTPVYMYKYLHIAARDRWQSRQFDTIGYMGDVRSKSGDMHSRLRGAFFN